MPEPVLRDRLTRNRTGSGGTARPPQLGETQRRGTKITFKPDSTIFEVTEFSFETLSGRLRELAFLNAGLKITIEDERSGKKHEFLFKDGIREARLGAIHSQQE